MNTAWFTEGGALYDIQSVQPAAEDPSQSRPTPSCIIPMKAELLFLFLTFGVLPSVCGGNLIIPAVVGGDVTLPCKADRNQPLDVVEWSRPGTITEFVLIFRTQHPEVLEVQKKSYEGRVELKDRETGDMSLVLRNVTAEDGGTYECYVLRERSRRKRAEPQPISNRPPACSSASSSSR
ncbi:butyrophilin subfamily 2 member A1-like [Fundulus heteroclitus]|uniref:butyrophilin subfamily 2 member A1-like n=1 Tax=Fundulus heteroclitus TaxID=8078 RepID=UPI00165BC51A|nr:butyrophilin subfamily 2 member A1-like [Fundulus heteroclitus]